MALDRGEIIAGIDAISDAMDADDPAFGAVQGCGPDYANGRIVIQATKLDPQLERRVQSLLCHKHFIIQVGAYGGAFGGIAEA